MGWASAPLRVDLTGGFTDLPDIYREVCGFTLNFAIRLRTFVHLVEAGASNPFGDHPVAFYSLNPDSPTFAERLVFWADQILGCRGLQAVTVRTDGPRGCGLGSSAALAVSIVAAAAPELLEADIVEVARLAEIKAGNECGLQDQIAAAYGGISAVEYLPSEPFRRIAIDSPGVYAVERFGSLWLKEAPRMSGNVVGQVLARLLHGDTSTRSILTRINGAYSILAGALRDGSVHALIAGTREVYATQMALHEEIVPAAVRGIVDVVERRFNGAAKLQGGGGVGGTLFILTPEAPTSDLRSFMSANGYRSLPLLIERWGIVRDDARIL